MREYLDKCYYCKTDPKTHPKCANCDILIHSKEYPCKKKQCQQPHTLKVGKLCIGCDDVKYVV